MYSARQEMSLERRTTLFPQYLADCSKRQPLTTVISMDSRLQVLDTSAVARKPVLCAMLANK